MSRVNLRLVPWWAWVVAVVLLLVATAMTAVMIMRDAAMRELRSFAAELEASGRGIAVQRLVDGVPIVDPARQAAAWMLLGAGSSIKDPTVPVWGMQARFPRPSDVGRMPAEKEAFLTATLGKREAWRRLRAEGPVTLGLIGWLREDIPDPARASAASAGACRTMSMQAAMQLATAFATEARASADPGAALAELSALVAATGNGGAIIDTMIRLRLRGILDEARLEAALRGADARAWSREMPDTLDEVAESLRTERLLMGGGFYQDITSGRGIGTTPGMGISWPLADRFGQWVYGAIAPHDVVVVHRGELLGEDLCRTGIGDVAKMQAELARQTWRHPIASIALPNLLEIAIAGVQHDVSGRRFRIAALLAQEWLESGRLPADEAALPAPCSALAAASKRCPAIRYQRIADSRFRLWTDPATPATDLLPAGRIDAPVPSTAPWTNRRWWLELDLSGIGQP